MRETGYRSWAAGPFLVAFAAMLWGTDGIWWTISLTATARGVAMVLLWRAGGWKHKSV